eukprot:SM000125S26084  [mRNA]  locus=s125:247521:249628:- [translate_table: standard]
MRQRRGRAAAEAPRETEPIAREEAEDVDGAEGSDAENEEDDGQAGGGTSKKEAKRRQKEARREAEAAVRDAKQDKRDAYAERQRQKEKALEDEEKRAAAAAAEAAAASEAAAAAELDSWKGMFSVENEGTVEADAATESQGLLAEFVDYFKEHKCVVLEDLAAEFGLRTQEVVSRVQALEQMGRISGVMDERGKFIYVSPEEMRAVADYIVRVGRVSIADLAARSSDFIDLEPKRPPAEAEPDNVAGDDEVPEMSSAAEPWQASAPDQSLAVA